MTKVALEAVDAVRRRLAVEISAGEVAAEIDRAYEQLRRTACVPGFRLGRAPRSVLDRQFGKRVRAEVVGRLVAESYAAAIRDHRLDPVSRPEIVTEHAKPGAPLRYSATIEVRPSIVVGGYMGMELKRPRRIVRDVDVDNFIVALRERQAELVSIADRRVARRGDIARVDFEAKIAGRRIGSGRGRLIEVGGESGLGSCLEGAEIGVGNAFAIPYREGGSLNNLAGQTVLFQVTVLSLLSKKLPLLDDEFATRVGFESMAALRVRVHERLTHAAERDAENALRSTLIERLIAAHTFEVPNAMVERRIDALVQEGIGHSATHHTSTGRDADARAGLYVELERRARSDVKAALVLQAIAEQEALTVSDAEVDARVNELVKEGGKEWERVRTAYADPEARQALRDQLLQEQAVEFIRARASVTDVPVSSGVAGASGNG